MYLYEKRVIKSLKVNERSKSRQFNFKKSKRTHALICLNPRSPNIFEKKLYSALMRKSYSFCILERLNTISNKFSRKKKLFELPLRSEKSGRFERILGFARSHSIVTRGSVSLSYATTTHLTCFSKFERYEINKA